MKAIIYDCEIKNAIPDKNEQLRPNINYCKGWTDFLGMGISVISVYDYHVGQFRIFCEDNLSDFAALIDDSDHVIGFNQIHFDNKLIAAHGIEFDPRKNWDLYVEAKGAAGADKYAKGYKLDDFVFVNFRIRKKQSGAFAPILWQQGKMGQVIDYGLTDTWLTKKCIDLIVETGAILDPRTGQTIKLSIPL